MAKFIADVDAPLTGSQYEMIVDAVDEAQARDRIEAGGLTVRQLRAVSGVVTAEPVGDEAIQKLREEVRVLRHRVDELDKRSIGYLGAAIAGVIGVIIVNLVLSGLR